MAKHWFGRPGYKGHGYAKRYLASKDCKDWLASLQQERRAFALRQLEDEAELDALQARRDCLANFVEPQILFDPWYNFKHPADQLNRQIETLMRAKESLEAEGDTVADRRREAERDRAKGYQDFLISGLSVNAYGELRKRKYFYNLTTGEPLTARQIDRIIRKFQRAQSAGPRAI